jgi:hypothetical protein
MPYGAMRRSGRPSTSGTSPQGIAVSTPSDVVVTTPSSVNASSPHAAASPTSLVLKQRVAFDRTHLFLQGRHGDLLKSMNQKERRWAFITSVNHAA